MWEHGRTVFTETVFPGARRALRRAMLTGSRQLAVGIYCKSGRHRSVAGTEILAHVLRADGYHVQVPEHSASMWWRWVCCQRQTGGRCPACTQQVTPDKAALYTKALAAWREGA